MFATDPRAEAVYLFGEHAVGEAERRGAAWHLRRLDHGEFRLAVHELRELTGADRQRYAREQQAALAGALILFLLDPDEWNRAVLEAQIRVLPARRPKADRPVPRDTSDARPGEEEEDGATGVKPVRKRRFQSRLKRRRRKTGSDGDGA